MNRIKLSEGLPGLYSQDGYEIFILGGNRLIHKCIFDRFLGKFRIVTISLSSLDDIIFLLNLAQISKEEASDKLFKEYREVWGLRGGDLDYLQNLINSLFESC